MINSRALRKLAVVSSAAALLLAGIAIPASAGHKSSHASHGAHATKAKGPKADKVKGYAKSSKSQGSRGAAKAAAAKARKAARFQATGTLLAVDGDTVAVYVTGGPVKSWRRTAVDFDAASADINRNDAAASLLDLVAGDHVAVKGMRVEGVLVALRINAEGPEPVVEEPTEEVTETVTEEPTETVTETVTEGPSEVVTEPVL